MPFLKKVWQNEPSGGTPITAVEMNRIEEGIAEVAGVLSSGVLTGVTPRPTSEEDGTPRWKTTFAATLTVNMANIVEHWIGSKLVGWQNEWGALRGRNPYPTYGDSLLRGIIMDGDFVSNGNFAELVDRRAGMTAPRNQLWARRWFDGRLVRNGIPHIDVYYHQGSGPIPWADLPDPVLVVADDTLAGPT